MHYKGWKREDANQCKSEDGGKKRGLETETEGLQSAAACRNNHSFWWCNRSRSPCTEMVSAASLFHLDNQQISSHIDIQQLWKVNPTETCCLCIFSNSSSDDVTSPPRCLPVKPHFLSIIPASCSGPANQRSSQVV